MLLKRTLIAAILASPATPLAAQDLTFNTEITASCVAHAPDLAGQMACVGASANACMEDTPGGSSTVAMSGCLDRELQYWDDKLNEHYASALRRARDADEYVDGTPSATALREMQRAWIVFRDKACTYEASLWQGGTGRGPAAINCLMHQTARQALSLDVWEG